MANKWASLVKKRVLDTNKRPVLLSSSLAHLYQEMMGTIGGVGAEDEGAPVDEHEYLKQVLHRHHSSSI